LTVQTDANANFGAPVPVDVVFANSPELDNQLMPLTAAEWFAKRAQLQRDYPEESILHVVSFEFIPGQQRSEQKIKGNGAEMAIIFVNMGRSSATNRARVPIGSTVSLRIGEGSYQLELEK
jgi:type VI secretion system protein